MADDESGSRTGGNIHIGGDVTGGAVASGKKNSQMVSFNSPDAEERRQVLQALTAIQAELAKLSGPTAPTAKSLAGTAVETAKEEKPNKDEIGNLLDTALRSAKSTAEFVDVAGKLAPHVRTAAHWLGGQWISLASLLS